ncbi:KAT8 regulatory NSL complex subunit 1-like isoform X2 [Hemicordylus capensis]|uniref:KAT8 regulatory NSL complex subunit 1-like isoform X2 n=1 Tax=Hemicordylus capensis TaxID=884348 RepID=UPI0023024BEF|nr:KAT8 regulatory NSL complex subunit 1-like isoform X2 [Hemicordylus capensis]
MAAAAAGPAMALEDDEEEEEDDGRRQAEARFRQSALWGRARSLRRRLRALQARQVERHVRQQLAGLARSVAAGRPGSRALPPAPALLPSAGPAPASLGSELRQLAASATARLRAAQRACDSDATDSASVCSSASSGCCSSSSSAGSSLCCSRSSSSPSSSSSDTESPDPPPRSAAVGHHLAERQWAMERAAIICRWTWLQAQVSDLEYRIRQQTDVYKQLRANKGPVVLGDLQHEDVLKQQNRLGSPAVANSRRNKVLPPSSSHLKVPTGDRQCDLSPCIPSYLTQNTEKQNSRLAQSLRNLVCQSPSCTPINGSPEPPKACTSPHQVNGISNCFNTCSTSNNTQDGGGTDRILKKPKQLNNSLPATSSLDNSCVAARIRPICRYRKRRLVRVNAVSHLSRKPQKPLAMKCSCEQPSSCILCDCKASIQTIDAETMSLEERVALLDSGFHPILSFSHGNPLHLHFEALLREDHRLNHKLKNWGMKGLNNNICSSALSASGSLLKESVSHNLFIPSPQTHKPSPLHHVPSLCPESGTPPPSNQVPGNSMAMGNSVLPAKKKKVECSYDINNIVIPMSMAAATRVEKLQYKEILTPSWRMVDPKELETSEEVGSELEDTSDEVYLNHHQKFEELERTRWDSWAGNISHKRGNRGSNKGDGRWIPQPGSPDTGSPYLNHLQCVNSLTGSLSPELPNVVQPILMKGKSRGSLSFSEDTSFSIPEMDDDIQNIQPWELRTFPLSDKEYQALQNPPHEALGKQTSAIQQWDSGSNRGLRTNNINSSACNPREPFMSSWQMQSSSSKHQEELAGQHCITPRLINHR